MPFSTFISCHPNLQKLQLSLDKAEIVVELFYILQNNTTLKALRLAVKDRPDSFRSMGPSL